jgi:alkylated DNA repair dioxygenase AlkB
LKPHSISEIAQQNSVPLNNISNLVPFDGELYLFPNFFNFLEADRLFTIFKSELAWQEVNIFIFGKWLNVPRLMCWYGDSNACYRYSGVDHQPIPWTSTLLTTKKRVEQYCQSEFNSVLANLYRDERDSMGCHADDEKELGINPVIASLSLGEQRLFKLHHKKRKETLQINLNHGDLLVMRGTLQYHWVHSIPKTKQAKNPRINLTFRHISAN